MKYNLVDKYYMNYHCRTFAELDTSTLYDILALRQVVCMIEFSRYYLDCDGLDQQALHITLEQNGTFKGYTRLLPPGLKYPCPTIGRVIITKDLRGTGKGADLMRYAMDMAKKHFGGYEIALSAQVPVVPFYEKLGFSTVGEPYIEADMPHVKMVRML